jgi:hypothetical protein
VKAKLDRYGADKERTIYAQVAPLLSRCGEDTHCYLAELDKPAKPDPGRVRGSQGGLDTGHRGRQRCERRAHRVPSPLGEPEGLMASAFALDHLTPLDPNPVAEKLEAVVTAGHWSNDTVRRILSSPFSSLRDVIARLRGRAR